MNITEHKVKVKDIVEGYFDDAEGGVTGLSGKLNIRPAYQREFVYKDKQREDVIRTVRKGFPLNVLYWVVTENGFEVLDGQQRTISICQYVDGEFAIDHQYFHNLESDEQEQILNYELNIFHCEGTDKEKLEWWDTINIAGEKLKDQEVINAIYTGPWLADAKRYFSRQGGAAYQIGNQYIQGSANRQDYLAAALKWISNNNVGQYMADHQFDTTAIELWNHFNNVINWVQSTFPNYRSEMKSVNWGDLYRIGTNKSPEELEIKLKSLMQDDEIQRRGGIYRYLITNDEFSLRLRTFTDNQKRKKFEEQNGICPRTGNKFDDFKDMHADHVDPWSKGGKTELDNLEMVCPKYNRRKSNK